MSLSGESDSTDPTPLARVRGDIAEHCLTPASSTYKTVSRLPGRPRSSWSALPSTSQIDRGAAVGTVERVDASAARCIAGAQDRLPKPDRAVRFQLRTSAWRLAVPEVR